MAGQVFHSTNAEVHSNGQSEESGFLPCYGGVVTPGALLSVG